MIINSKMICSKMLICPTCAGISHRGFYLCCNLQQARVISLLEFGNPKLVENLMMPLVKLGHRSSSGDAEL